jgi:hypothetical protein
MSGAARGFITIVPSHPDRRSVRLAVAVIDAATGAQLVEGVEVKASGLEGRAVTNPSGFFVLLDEPGRPTGEITVSAPGQPFMPVGPVMPPPGHDRREALRIPLLPSRAYPVRTGVLAARGRVLEASAPLRGVTVLAETLTDGPRRSGRVWTALPFNAETDSAGEYLRLLPLPAQAFVANGSAPPTARLRLRFRRGEGKIRSGPYFVVAPNEAPMLPDFDWTAIT